jgi:protocatechuate 3,4-dioxygenase beta subunit
MSGAVAACAASPSAGGAATPSPTANSSVSPTGTAACSRQTHAQTEGPYFKSGSPERSSLVETGMSGTRLQLTGQVLDSACRPIARALLDFWQADAAGAYDNSGYRLRGHEFSDANGRFSMQTIVPGLYPGRTRHIHVKVQPPAGSTLTTQLYFPGEARNAQDSIFDAALLLQVSDSSSGKLAIFSFVTGSA